jgi:hypothetical protein
VLGLLAVERVAVLASVFVAGVRACWLLRGEGGGGERMTREHHMRLLRLVSRLLL